MEHSSFFFGAKFNTLPEKFTQIFTLQLFKSGTIIFFLLAGFLIGDKFKTYSTTEYLKRRADNTLKPWAFWVVVLLILNYVNEIIIALRFGDQNSKFTLQGFGSELANIVFNTSFWFIPNFLICITIILCFRRYLYSLTFGLILLVLSLTYSLNIYLDLFPTAHTTALFGFIFYLWLGVQLNKYFEKFEAFINNTSLLKITFSLLLTFIFASLESYHLLAILPTDPFNTLRITNILYSIVSFCFLYKIVGFISINKLNPRFYTFGLYLIHQILIFRLVPMIFKPLGISLIDKTAYYFLAVQIFVFLIVYPTSMFIVWLINKSARLRWIIGQ